MRRLPGVDALLAEPALGAAVTAHGHELVSAALRRRVEALRGRLRAEPEAWDAAAVDEAAACLSAETVAELDARAAGRLVPVLNATGVLVHTNLGRAPLGAPALERLAAGAGLGLNLELDLETGRRGKRAPGCDELLAELTGAEAACVVNNCAAALLLVLNALAKDRPVVVSRGELVEIGGSFRIPDICERSGVALAEVGTTNRTRIADYAAAFDAEPKPAMLLKVHPSNFRVVGFTEETSIGELVALGREQGVPVVMDQGSGALEDLAPWGVEGETPVPAMVGAGADLVLFSGDKLLGGPQAGCIVGKRESVEACRRNPLFRALRSDRLRMLALEATLWSHASGRADGEVPVLAQLKLPASDVKRRAEALAASLKGMAASCELVEDSSTSGGGSSPTSRVPTFVLRLKPPGRSVDELAHRLRTGSPRVLARIAGDALVLDLRTIPETHDEALGAALRSALTA
jgi:L-seryl-tRNA(Ser) seleniumtransferase